MISDKHKAIFVHVPKTAGTTIEKHFGNMQGHHNTARQYKVRWPNKWDQYYTFAFVRNSWDWYASFFRFYYYLERATLYENTPRTIKNQKNRQRWFRGICKNFKQCVDQQRYLVNARVTGVHFNDQHPFVCNSKDEEMPDYVGDYGHFKFAYDKICVSLYKEPLKKSYNTLNNGRHYSAWYSDEMAEKIAKIYSKDIELFNFEFERVEDYDPDAWRY